MKAMLSAIRAKSINTHPIVNSFTLPRKVFEARRQTGSGRARRPKGFDKRVGLVRIDNIDPSFDQFTAQSKAVERGRFLVVSKT